MAEPRRSQDVVGFRRIFVLFCTLVLLPAMLMSGFAVVAIGNERSAQKQQQRERGEALARDAEAAFAALLGRTDQAVRQATPEVPGRVLEALRTEGLPVGPALLLDETAQVLWTDERPPLTAPAQQALLDEVAPATGAVPVAGVAHVAIDRPALQGLASVHRLRTDRFLVYLVDEERLARTLSARDPRTELTVLVRPVVQEPQGVGALERWMGELMKDAPPEESSSTIVERRLPAPFERYAVLVAGPEPDLTAIVVYVILLIVFYAALITGVVLTSRLIWQETRLSRLKTDFVSHVSHELRTPLTSIRMFIETLRMGRANEAEREECLELLSRETERLSEMIERVLGYARLRSGRRIFEPRPVPVEDLVGGAVDAFRAHILGEAPADLTLEVDLEEGLPPVLIDREALVEALLNLLGNAYKYTGEKKKIRIFARRARRRVVVGVEDNGPGLPKSEWGRIFDRFYRAGADLLSRPASGSGLGLAITKEIVEGNRGRIHVDSELGRGTVFLVELRPAEGDGG